MKVIDWRKFNSKKETSKKKRIIFFTKVRKTCELFRVYDISLFSSLFFFNFFIERKELWKKERKKRRREFTYAKKKNKKHKEQKKFNLIKKMVVIFFRPRFYSNKLNLISFPSSAFYQYHNAHCVRANKIVVVDSSKFASVKFRKDLQVLFLEQSFQECHRHNIKIIIFVLRYQWRSDANGNDRFLKLFSSGTCE